MQTIFLPVHHKDKSELYLKAVYGFRWIVVRTRDFIVVQ